MNEIDYEGFVARIVFGSDNYLRGTVRDTHEPIELQGLTLSELRADFASKIDAYKERCARRGIQPFATYEGKPTTELDALDLEMLSGNFSREHPAWPHRHTHFFDAKRQMILDGIPELEKAEATAVPSQLRLPLDDIVEELRHRSRSPQLLPEWKEPKNIKILNLYIRYRLADCFLAVSKADPRNRDDAIEHIMDFLEHARQVQVQADKFHRTYRTGTSTLPTFNRGIDAEDASLRFQSALQTESYLIHFLRGLNEMMGWAYDDLDDVAPARGGRPRLSWRYDFIAGLAGLWRQITSREPSYKPDGLFTRFVEAAWQSGGSDMPTVPWDDIVRTYRRGSRFRKGGGNPSSNN